MKYYSHNIGDFDKKTRHLTRIERSIYSDLIDVYYDTEKPLDLNIAALCRKIIAREQNEKEAVLAVLDEFFVETPLGWFHSGCEEVIAAYRKTTSQASEAGKASAAAKKKRLEDALNGKSTAVEQPFDSGSTEVQPTINHNPENKKSSGTRGTRLPEDWHPTAEETAFCKAERPDLRPSEVAKNFYDYWTTQPGAKGVRLNWPRVWQSWVRKEKRVPDSQRPHDNLKDII